MESEATRHQLPTGTMFRHATSCSFRVSGSDTLDWLDRMLTAEVRVPGQVVVRSLCLDRLGKIHGELLCWLGSESADLIMTGGERAELIEHLSRHIIMEEVAIEVTADTLYSSHGQEAERIASQLGSTGGVRGARIFWLRPNDYVWLVPAEDESEWLRNAERLGVSLGNAQQWEQLRIEAGMPRLGRDYTFADTPSVAGLVSDLVSQTKGCYLGQEVVCRTIMRGGVREQVTRLKFEQAPSIGATIRLAASGEAVGSITSVSEVAPQSTWAIGRVKTGAIAGSARVTVDGIAGQISARVRSA